MNNITNHKANIEADLRQLLQLPELATDELNFNFQRLSDKQTQAELCTISIKQLQAFERLHSKRLGIYYELLWRTLLENGSQFKIQLQNQQVIDNKITLGEFDFILEDSKQQQSHHLEIAIKFYLNTSHLFAQSTESYQSLSTNSDFWRGPNSDDSLHIKYVHLISKQLQLSRHTAAKKLLAEHNIRSVLPLFSLKGFLFNHWLHDAVAPLHFNQNAPLYHWLYIDELSDYINTYQSNELSTAENKHCKLFYIEKPAWIRQQHYMIKAISAENAADLLKGKDSPILLAWAEVCDGVIIEKQRMFIAPMNWPKQKTKQSLRNTYNLKNG